MKKLLFLTTVFCFGLLSSQENWDYLPVEISNNYHGAICPIDENIVHVVSDYGKFYKTIDGGETWAAFDSGVNEFFFDLAFDGSTNGYAVGNNGKILKTTNAGQTWSELSSGTNEALLSVAINANNSIWAVGDNGTVLHSNDGGNSWILNNSLTSEKLNSIKFKDENIGYIAGDNGVLLYTENGGDDWEQLPIPATDDLFAISLTDNNIYVIAGSSDTYYQEFSYSGDEVYRSNNSIDWITTYLNTLEYGPADISFTQDNVGFSINSARTVSGLCPVVIEKTINSGETWNEIYYEYGSVPNCHSNVGYGKIKFATEEVGFILLGENILKTPYESAGVEDFSKDHAFTIYPNPTTNGNFNLKITSTNTEGLSLEIVDMTGKKIYTKSNLRENNSISTPNISEGIYFVKLLKNGKLVATQKLIKGN